MAANLAEVARWRARQAGAVDLQTQRVMKKQRTPRSHTIKRLQEPARREGARARKAAAEAVVEYLAPPLIK